MAQTRENLPGLDKRAYRECPSCREVHYLGTDDPGRNFYPVECFGGPFDGEWMNYFLNPHKPVVGGEYVIRFTKPHYRYEWVPA